MNEITDKQKIGALERLLTAIVGRQGAQVRYRQDFESMTQVIVECDPDCLLPIKGELSIADINFDFYVTQKKCEPSELFPEPYEGICEVTFYLEEQYYKTAEKLRKKVQVLEEENKKLKETSPKVDDVETKSLP